MATQNRNEGGMRGGTREQHAKAGSMSQGGQSKGSKQSSRSSSSSPRSKRSGSDSNR